MKPSYFITVAVLFSLISCNYDRATFYYADIAPKAPTGVAISATNANTAIIKWSPADDSANPAPEFNIYTLQGTVTNLFVTISNDVRESEITGLTTSTTYSAWVQATNRAGTANSSSVTFTTQ